MLNQSDSAIYYFQETMNKYPKFEHVYIELAKIHANEENYELALEYCSKLLDINDQSIDAHYIKSLVYFYQGKIKKSVKEVKTSLKSHPNNFFLNTLLGNIYYLRNKETQAINSFTIAIESAPDISISYLMRGISYIRKMKYSYAFSDFMIGYKLDSSNSMFPLFMGYSSIRLNNVETGIIALSKYIEMEMENEGEYYSQAFADLELYDLILYLNKYGTYDDEQKVGYLLVDLIFSYDMYEDYTFIKKYANDNPKSVFASRVYNYLLFMRYKYNLTQFRTNTLISQNDSLIFIKVLNASLKDNAEKYVDCIFILDQVVEQAPYYTAAYNNRAEAYVEIGNYTKAFRDFSYALKLNPDYYLARANRGDLYFQTEKYRDALNDFLNLNITSPLLSKTIGQCYNKLSIYDSAIIHLSKAVELNPHYHQAYQCRAEIYTENGNLKNALKDYNRCINYDINNALYYFERAMVEKKLGMIDSVIFDLNIAIQIDPNYSSPYGELGWAYYLKGKYFDSIKYSMLMLQKKQGSFFAMYNLALAKLRLGNLDSSRQFYLIFAEEDFKKNQSINQKAIDDLKYLIDNDIYKKPAQEILDAILNIGTEKELKN
ncbi:MAG: tetratricopeptide repeat protein [Bacteroidota bacterium]